MKINGYGNASGSHDGEIGGVPLGPIGGKEADAVARFDAKFDQGHGESSYATQQFR